MTTTLLPLGGLASPEDLIPELSRWVHEAGNPYFDWLYGGAVRAHATVMANLASPESELSVRSFVGLFDCDELIGAFLGLPGPELARRRRADTLKLIRGTAPDERARLREALEASRELLASPGDRDFQLVSIAVSPGHRGEGRGRRLLEGFLSTGRAAGFSHFGLEVWSENLPARRLYEAAGFEIAAQRHSERAAISYLWMTRRDSAPRA